MKIKQKLLKGDYPNAQKWIKQNKRNFDILYAIYPEVKYELSILTPEEISLNELFSHRLIAYEILADLLITGKLKQDKGQKDLLEFDF